LKLKKNKQRGQLCTLIVKREKKKKKQKQSITDGNSTTISLCVSPHIENDTTVFLRISRIARISYQVVSHIIIKLLGDKWS
jgi:hypothetical protein